MPTYDIRDLLKQPILPEDAERPLTPLAEEIAARPVKPTYSPVVLAGIARVVDFAIVAVTGLAVHALYLKPGSQFPIIHGFTILAIAMLTVIVFQALGIYHISSFRAMVTQGLRLLGGWCGIFLILMAALFFAKRGEDFSRVWLASWFVVGLILLAMGRAILSYTVKALTRAGRLDRRTAIVGGGPAAEELIRALDAQPDTGLRICGVFDDRNDERSPDIVAGYPKLGNVSDLVEFARRAHLDLVIFTLPITAEDRLLSMLRKLWVLPIDIRLAAHRNKLRLRPRAYSYIGAVPVLDVFDKPIADWDLVLKWLFDKFVGTLLIILLSPVLAATAIAVKLDSRGPILFRQKRYGFNNELIEVFKFRSMYVDQSDADAARLVTKGDPRVTRVGRFIRKTSLDELPQLFNVVFKGDLSLVGPRPHAVKAKAENRLYDKVVDGYFARHRVKPGITGWAQINGWRGETDTEEKLQRRVEHDLFYIENWSVLFDLYILARTPFALLSTENAY
ncbi:Undecaprenyl-phosphate glucose phosphotransferase [Hyphomicrobiales bacterium]|nr:Undecaprenyl-phosphate glucose phosphotransferase [Hyphomicrobiales bacterium]CAH1666174.1 Undecaprenyl-phosphate glucose phosphotransferase [Hyphomicrobiales bacterium]